MPSPDGALGANGADTAAAEAGLDIAFVTGIIGGSYAVEVFILENAGAGGGLFDIDGTTEGTE